MRNLARLILLAPTAAAAESVEPIATKSTTGHAAIAVNSPLGWANDSYAASGYARFAEHDITQRDTQLVAARALVGWSWLIADRAMISFAVGAASGYEFGQQTTANTLPEEAPMMTIDVGEWKTRVEGYLRFGFAFDQ